MNKNFKSADIGQCIDNKYKILAHLGSGGMGEVYKAIDLSFDRVVALKILHKNAALDEAWRERFIREAKILCGLEHLNIVGVYSFGITSDTCIYFAMEYVEGQNIRTVLMQSKKLPVLQALTIIGIAADALAYAHKHGVVHRDLKPENILLTNTPEENTVKLVDFGLALNYSNENLQKLTLSGELIGTPSFMSPEQCKGKKVDFCTDIYSLSVCLYEMITGTPAFIDDTQIGLMYKQMNEQVPAIRPSQVDQFDEILNAILQKGMAKEPTERFASMEEMSAEIQRAIARLQGTQRTVNHKNKYFLHLAVGASALMLLAGIIGLYCSPHSEKNQSASGKRESLRLDGKSARIQPAVLSQRRMLQLAREKKNEELALTKAIDKDEQDCPNTWKQVQDLFSLGDFYGINKDFDRQTIVEVKGFKIAESLSKSEDQLLPYLEMMASMYYVQHKSTEFLEMQNREISMLKHARTNVQALVEGYKRLGIVCNKPGDIQKSVDSYRQALSLLEKGAKEDPYGWESEKTIEISNLLGKLYTEHHQFSKAGEIYTQAMKKSSAIVNYYEGVMDVKRKPGQVLSWDSDHLTTMARVTSLKKEIQNGLDFLSRNSEAQTKRD